MANSSGVHPTKEQLLRARESNIPDVIGHNLSVLFCGINPGLYSAYVGHHFARPGNRFWKALHGSGFTDRVLYPYEKEILLTLRLGLTDLVARATASASELTQAEFDEGRTELELKIRRYKPHTVAILGVTGYRRAFRDPHAGLGLQTSRVASTQVWVLPNPSGLNAHHQMPDLLRRFEQLRESIE